MKKRAIILAATASLLAGSALAGAMGPSAPSNDWRFVGTLSAGPAWASGGKTQTFYLAPEVEKTYAADKSTHAFVDGELFLGMQRQINDKLQGQLGVAIAATNFTRVTGTIWDDADPVFNNYTYNYKIRHNHLAIKGKLLADVGYMVTPWVSGSLGVGINRADGFNNNPTIFEAVPNANFAGNSETAFTYTIGAGVQKAIDEHFSVGAGYEFADWGKSQLHRAAGQTLNPGLKLSHLYTNGVLFNLTYLA